MLSPNLSVLVGNASKGKILMDQEASTSNGGQAPSSHVGQHIKGIAGYVRWVSYMSCEEQEEPMESHGLLCRKEGHTSMWYYDRIW